MAPLAVVVYDRGPAPEWYVDRRPWRRYEAELEGHSATRELGSSPWALGECVVRESGEQVELAVS